MMPGGTARLPATETSRIKNATGSPRTTALTLTVIGSTDATSTCNPGIDEKLDEEVATADVRQASVWQFTAQLPLVDVVVASVIAGSAMTIPMTPNTISHFRILLPPDVIILSARELRTEQTFSDSLTMTRAAERSPV